MLIAVPGPGELQRELPGVHHAGLPVPDSLHGDVRHSQQNQGEQRPFLITPKII